MRKKYNVDHRVIGAEVLLNPFPQNTSTARQAMFASQTKQFNHIHSEPALISSGFEYQFDKLQLNPTLIEEPSSLIGYIPKALSDRSSKVQNYTVIYHTNKDKLVKYFDIDQYTLLNRGEDFAYLNDFLNMNLLMYGKGALLPAGTSFSVSPSSIQNMYYVGVNANAAYISHTDVLNDSVILSESLAEKMETVGCKKYTISLTDRDIPLNIHGTFDDYRILPEIGEIIDDGILFACRPAEPLICASDLSENSLQRINILHDTIYRCPKDAYIVDIEVDINPSQAKVKHIREDEKLSQFFEISKMYYKYYKSIIDIYESIKEQDLVISPEMNALVTHAMGMIQLEKHAIKDTPVNFIECRITVAFPRQINAGNKITCRGSNKGVIASIWPDEHMPITEDGVRADIIISDNAPFNRLNSGQWNEQFINYASEIIRKRVNDGLLHNFDTAFNYIMSLKDVIAKTDKELMQNMTADDPTQRQQFIEELKEFPIYHCIPPFATEITSGIYQEIMDKFQIGKSNWSYINPLTKERVHSRYPTIIGSKYLYLLGKLPENSVHVVQIGYRNQLGLPMKETKDSKQRNPFSNTVIRMGVDESCITMACVPTSSVARYMGINGNSEKAVKELQRRLSTDPYPSQLFRIDMTTREILDNGTNIAIFNHLVNCCGLKTDSVKNNNFMEINQTTPFKIVDPKRKKVFSPIDDKPYLTNILINGQEVELSKLYNFKLVDSLMSSKLKITEVLLSFSDGSKCKIKPALAILNFILWEVFINFYTIPSKEDIFIVKGIKGGTISELYTKIYYKFFDKDNYIFVLERLWMNINYINKFNSLYLSEYNSTMCGIDLSEIIQHPKMQELLKLIPAQDESFKDAEIILNKLTDRLIVMLLNGEIPSTLKKFIETDRLNIQQIGQMLIAYGPRDDIDSKIPRYVIQNSCFDGLKSIQDFAIESLSVKKSAYYNRSSIEEAGVFGKHFRIAAETQLTLHPGSCGNVYTSKITLKPHWKNGLIDRIIMIDGQSLRLTEENIMQFIGKEINLRSAVNCKLKYGVCETCAGYGDPGVLIKFTTPGSIIGTVGSSEVAKFIMQFILSNKHLNKTDAFTYALPNEALPFMEKSQGGVMWRRSIWDTLKKFHLRVASARLGKLDDLLLDIKAPDSWSCIDSLSLMNPVTGEIVGDFEVKNAVIEPFFSAHMLQYLKKIYKQIQITEDGYVHFPLEGYDPHMAPLKYNLMNQDMRRYVTLAKSFFNSKISKLTEVDVLDSAYELIYSKTTLPSYFIDLIIKAYRTERIEKKDKLSLRFKSTAALLEQRDIASKLRHEKTNMWLTKTSTYLTEKSPSVADAFFGF